MNEYTLTAKDIMRLRNESHDIAVSIYSPLDNESPEAVNSNHIRIKNVLSDIENIIDKHKSTFKSSRHKLMQPLQQMLYDKQKLWHRQYQSIVVFMNEKKLRYYFLPTKYDKNVTVGDSYQLGPLRSYIANNKEYFILSASYNHVALYKADGFTITEVTVPGLPQDGAEKALEIDEYPNATNFHPGKKVDMKSTSGRHGFSMGVHGHYNRKEVEKGYLKQYFRMVDEALRPYLRNSNAPLIFAGVEYLFPIYQSVNSYKQLHTNPVEGNFEHTNLNDLLDRAKRVIHS